VTELHTDRRKAGYATFKSGDHGGVGGRHATGRLEGVPPFIARHLPGLFETRYSGGEAHPKRAVRYPALTRTAEPSRDLIMRLIEWPLRPQNQLGASAPRRAWAIGSSLGQPARRSKK
jgi:hypothetical protein